MNWKTRVTELLGIKYPIIQGGLAYLAYSELASAVSNAGGTRTNHGHVLAGCGNFAGRNPKSEKDDG